MELDIQEGSGLFKFLKKIFRRKKKLNLANIQSGLSSSFNDLEKLNDELMTQLQNISNDIINIAKECIILLIFILNNSDDVKSQRELVLNLSNRKELQEKFIKLRDTEAKIYDTYKKIKDSEPDVKNMETKLKSGKIDLKSKSKDKFKTPAELGVSINSDEPKITSSLINLKTYVDKTDEIYKNVIKALNDSVLYPYNFEKSKKFSKASKLNSVLSTHDTSSIFCNNDNFALLSEFFYSKADSSSLAPIVNRDLGIGEYSKLFKNIPLAVQRLFYVFSKKTDCKIIDKFLYDKDFKTQFEILEKELLDKFSDSFNSKIKDLAIDAIPITLLFHTIIYSTTSLKSNNLVISCITSASKLLDELISINESVDYNKYNSIDTYCLKKILTEDYDKLLTLCWNVGNNYSISRGTFKLAFYKMLNASPENMSMYLGVKVSEIATEPINVFEVLRKESEKKTVESLLGNSKSLPDAIVLMDVDDNSKSIINKSKENSYTFIEEGYNMCILKKSLFNKNLSTLEHITSGKFYQIYKVKLHNLKYILVILFIPFMKYSGDGDMIFNEEFANINEILKDISELPILIFASINGELLIDNRYGYKILKFSKSRYFFNYQKIDEKAFVLKNVFPDDQQYKCLDYVFYKLPKNMAEFKIRITEPFNVEFTADKGYITTSDNLEINKTNYPYYFKEGKILLDDLDDSKKTNYLIKKDEFEEITSNNDKAQKLLEKITEFTNNKNKLIKILKDNIVEKMM